jgi:FkbM family methyltransferase
MPVKIADCRHGRQMYLSTDVYFSPIIEKYGEYCWDEVLLWQQIVREGDAVVDAGANIGCHAFALARMGGAAGMVMAFEPQRPIHDILCGTIALNEVWQVSTYLMALGAERATSRLMAVDYDQPNNYGGVEIGDFGGHEVPVLPLDDFDIPSLRLLKADVEGHETELLLGARETIRRCRPALYVENDRQANSDRLIETMLGMDYSVYLHVAPLFREDNFRGCTENLYPKVVAVMLLGIPDEVPFETNLCPIRKPDDMVGLGKFEV